MSITRIASRYAKSLIELAKDQNKLDRVMEDIKGIKRMVGNRDFLLMLKSPVIPDHKKSKVVSLLLGDKLDELTMRFFQLLISKQRDTYMPEIIEEFIEQYKELRNINTIRVSSAVKLDEATIEKIKAKVRELGLVNGGQIEIVERINPELIGGFILEYKGYIYDSTVVQQLSKLKKKHFEENLYTSQFRAR